MKRRIQGLLLAASALALLRPTACAAQAMNPPYLSEMPSPARILAEIKGKDAEDTGERQMGAFMALVKLMDDMAWGLQHRYVNDADTRALTPDERRVRLAYQTAYADLWHKVRNKEDHVYDHDRDLLNEMLGKFFSDDFRALYFKSNKNAAAAYKAFHERMYPDPAKPPSNQAAQGPMGANGGPGSTSEMRGCIASGRSMRICFSEVMNNGFDQMIGINGLKPSIPAGPRMTGDYSSAQGFRLIFEPEQVTMVCRGVPAPRQYSVQLTDTQAVVNIENDSGPVVLSLRPDGALVGSGPIKVSGQVPAGSHTEQTMGSRTEHTTTTREVTPMEAQNYPSDSTTRNGQTYTIHEDSSRLVYGPTGSRTVTDYVIKTSSCTLGVLNPTGASPLPLVKNDMDILTTIGVGAGTLMNGGSADDAAKDMLNPGTLISPGLRMNGRYAGESGFSLDFHRESVTLGCGEAEQALEYSVRRTGSTTMLLVKDERNPLSFRIMADGSIVGEGTVQVNGRVITGTTGDTKNPFAFAPLIAKCTVGRLVAGGSATRTSTAPAPAPEAPASTPPAPGANVAPAAGGASLTIIAGPGVASLLAGKALMVLKESLEEVLGKGGINAQPGSSRVSTWTHACERSASDSTCQQGVGALKNYIVARTGFDRNGSATFNKVPSEGTFYIVADTSYSHHLLWNIRVDLKPGSNSVTLDERNKENIGR